MKRSDGERVRIAHSITRLRDTLDSAVATLGIGGSLGQELAQSLQLTANEVATQIARHDAFLLSEADALEELRARSARPGKR